MPSICVFLGLPDGSRDDETPREMSMAHARNQSLGRNIAVGLTLTGPALSRLLGGDLKKRAMDRDGCHESL